jgi:hypothetical protein
MNLLINYPNVVELKMSFKIGYKLSFRIKGSDNFSVAYIFHYPSNEVCASNLLHSELDELNFVSDELCNIFPSMNKLSKEFKK